MSEAAELDRPRFVRGTKKASPKRARSGKLGRAPNQYSERLGPRSRLQRLAQVDLRTRDGLIVNRLRKDLLARCADDPSVVQRQLIEQCCRLKLRLLLLDKKIATAKEFTEIDNNCYIAWSNALVRTMSRLGLERKRPSTRRPLAEIQAELEAAQ